jgi:hypothetical protein
MKPSWKEWLLLAIALVFTLAGTLMIFKSANNRELIQGLACTVFFGICAIVFTQTLWSRRQSRAHGANLSVTLQFGTVLKMGKTRTLLLACAFLVPGALFFLWGWQEPNWLIVGIGTLTALAGAVLLALVVLGIAGTGTMAFEKDGLRIGDRGGSVLLAWDNIAGLRCGDFNQNQMVMILIKNAEWLSLTGKGTWKKWSREGILKEIGNCRAIWGCDWGIITGLYGVNAMLLAKAMATYVTDPQVRAGLEDHLRLGV